jgi:hypothetical protein
MAEHEKDPMIGKKLQNQIAPTQRKPRDRMDGLGHPVGPSAMYFIQDARRGATIGNCALWWRHEAAGYACDLSEAGLFRGDARINLRDTDVLWPEDHVRAHAVTHVRADIEALQVRDPVLALVERDEEP